MFYFYLILLDLVLVNFLFKEGTALDVDEIKANTPSVGEYRVTHHSTEFKSTHNSYACSESE